MATKTIVVLSVVLFYTILTLFMGFLGSSLNQDFGVSVDDKSNAFFGTLFNNVVTGYDSLPFWFNVIIFNTLGVIVLWLILSSLPTFSGGS